MCAFAFVSMLLVFGGGWVGVKIGLCYLGVSCGCLRPRKLASGVASLTASLLLGFGVGGPTGRNSHLLLLTFAAFVSDNQLLWTDTAAALN